MKLSMNEILLMNALESVSGVSPKDCLVNGNLVSYFVKEAEVGKAIGKNASNMKFLEQKLNKKIEVIGYQEKPENVLAKTLKLSLSGVQVKPDKVIVSLDSLNKKKIMGNSGKLKRVKEFIERNYNVELIVN